MDAIVTMSCGSRWIASVGQTSMHGFSSQCLQLTGTASANVLDASDAVPVLVAPADADVPFFVLRDRDGTMQRLYGLHNGLTMTDTRGHGIGFCAMDHPLVSLERPGCWKYSTGRSIAGSS
mgnify:CR=1 FL=1